MTRKSKLLALALTMAFALSAVAASAASAEPALFTAEVGAGETAKVMGGQTEAFGNEFSMNGNPFACEVAALSGEAGTAGPSSTTVSLKPKYENCHVIAFGFITLPATVTVNGCEYKFNATKNTPDTESNNTPFGADLAIVCPENQQIEIHVYESAAKHANDEPLCTYDIAPQTVNSHIQLTNHANSPNDIIAHVTNLPIEFDNTIQSSLCGETTHPNAIYNGEATLTAEDEAGNPVNSSVS